MSSGIRSALLVLIFAASCLAQEGLRIQNNSKEKVPDAEAQRVYFSACAVVREEFHEVHLIKPTVTLVLGAERDETVRDPQEIRLTKWNPYLFAQGVVTFAFQNLLPLDRKLMMTTRAVSQADATVAVQRLAR